MKNTILLLMLAAVSASCGGHYLDEGDATGDAHDSSSPDASWAYGELFQGEFGDKKIESTAVNYVRIDPEGTWAYGVRGCNGTWESEFIGTWDVIEGDVLVLHTPEGGSTPHNWAQDSPKTYLRPLGCPGAEMFWANDAGVEGTTIRHSRGRACLDACGQYEMTQVECPGYEDPCGG